MDRSIIMKLTDKDNRYAYALTQKIVSESMETDVWYEYFDDFIELLDHPKSLVRNRAFLLVSANIQWDDENKFADNLDRFLAHITDEKPISSRKCIESSVLIGSSKPQYASEIISALEKADLEKYKSSMQPLIKKDIQQAISALQEVLSSVQI